MAQGHLPPQSRSMALYSFGGGFIGALLAIILAWIFTGGFCCDHGDSGNINKAASAMPVAAEQAAAVRVG